MEGLSDCGVGMTLLSDGKTTPCLDVGSWQSAHRQTSVQTEKD